MLRAERFYETVLGVELAKLESPDAELEMQAFGLFRFQAVSFKQ